MLNVTIEESVDYFDTIISLDAAAATAMIQLAGTFAMRKS